MYYFLVDLLVICIFEVILQVGLAGDGVVFGDVC